MVMAMMIARERSFFGFRASPASWTACSKPCSAKTTPAGSAAKMPCTPNGMNPPPVLKFPGWKDSEATTTIARSGTAVFQITTIALLSDMNLAPARFTAVNRTIITVATMSPRPLSRPALAPVACSIGKFWLTAWMLLT